MRRAGKTKSHRKADARAPWAAQNSVALANIEGQVEPGSPVAGEIFFADNTAVLDEKGRGTLRKVAGQYRSVGGQGFVRVVGHASSRTKDMPIDRHLEVNFKLSQDRANAVAEALVRAGVPADKVLVEAVSDSQPVYYESMPKGEEGNRRVEVYLPR